MSDQNSESPGSQNSGYSVNSMKQGTPGNSDGSASDEMFKQETSNSIDHSLMHAAYQGIHANIEQEQLLNSDDESTMIEDHILYGYDQKDRNKDTAFVQPDLIDLEQVLKETSDRIQDLISARSILYCVSRTKLDFSSIYPGQKEAAGAITGRKGSQSNW